MEFTETRQRYKKCSGAYRFNLRPCTGGKRSYTGIQGKEWMKWNLQKQSLTCRTSYRNISNIKKQRSKKKTLMMKMSKNNEFCGGYKERGMSKTLVVFKVLLFSFLVPLHIFECFYHVCTSLFLAKQNFFFLCLYMDNGYAI